MTDTNIDRAIESIINSIVNSVPYHGSYSNSMRKAIEEIKDVILRWHRRMTRAVVQGQQREINQLTKELKLLKADRPKINTLPPFVFEKPTNAIGRQNDG